MEVSDLANLKAVETLVIFLLARQMREISSDTPIEATFHTIESLIGSMQDNHQAKDPAFRAFFDAWEEEMRRMGQNVKLRLEKTGAAR